VFLAYDEADSKAPAKAARADTLVAGGIGASSVVMVVLVVGGVVAMVNCVAGFMSVREEV